MSSIFIFPYILQYSSCFCAPFAAQLAFYCSTRLFPAFIFLFCYHFSNFFLHLFKLYPVLWIFWTNPFQILLFFFLLPIVQFLHSNNNVTWCCFSNSSLLNWPFKKKLNSVIFKFSDFNKEPTSSLKMIWIEIETCWSVLSVLRLTF